MSNPSRSTPPGGEPSADPIAPGALARDLLALWGRPKGRPSKAPRAARASGRPDPPVAEPSGGLPMPDASGAGRRAAAGRDAWSEGTDLGRAIRWLRGERTQTQLCEQAGLDPATWSQYEAGRRRPLCRARHKGRSFVTDMLEAGVDVFTVQKLAGHADAVTTARYDRRRETAQREAAGRLALPAG